MCASILRLVRSRSAGETLLRSVSNPARTIDWRSFGLIFSSSSADQIFDVSMAPRYQAGACGGGPQRGPEVKRSSPLGGDATRKLSVASDPSPTYRRHRHADARSRRSIVVARSRLVLPERGDRSPLGDGSGEFTDHDPLRVHHPRTPPRCPSRAGRTGRWSREPTPQACRLLALPPRWRRRQT